MKISRNHVIFHARSGIVGRSGLLRYQEWLPFRSAFINLPFSLSLSVPQS